MEINLVLPIQSALTCKCWQMTNIANPYMKTHSTKVGIRSDPAPNHRWAANANSNAKVKASVHSNTISIERKKTKTTQKSEIIMPNCNDDYSTYLILQCIYKDT